MPPHVNISGYAGAGKTTISSLLWSRHKSIWIPRVTTRPPRPGESRSTEYFFVSRSEFMRMKREGKIIRDTVHLIPVEGEGHAYSNALLHPDLWPKPFPDTELKVSVFGSRAPLFKGMFEIEMINILLVVRSQEGLRERLLSRGGSEEKVHHHLALNEWYRKNKIGRHYDHVVYNDGTPEETVREIEEIVGLPFRQTAP